MIVNKNTLYDVFVGYFVRDGGNQDPFLVKARPTWGNDNQGVRRLEGVYRWEADC